MVEAKGRKHDEIEVVSTALWYYLLELRLSERMKGSSAYKIEKLIEPESFGINHLGEPYHLNKWRKYRIGLHKPYQATIDRAAFHVPESVFIINNILWEALRGRKELDWFANVGLRQLHLNVQKVIFQRLNRYDNNTKLISKLNARELNRLEQQAGLDALAALLYFLRLADFQNDREQTLAIGKSIYRTLLILCTYFPYRYFCNELLILFQQHVYPMAHNGCIGVLFDDHINFNETIFTLANLRLQLEDSGEIGLLANEGKKATSALLHGKWGFQIQLAFDAPIGLIEPPSTTNLKDQKFIDTYANLKKRSWEMLKAGKDVFSPEEPV